MLIEVNNTISISTLFNKKILTLNNSEDWSIWLRRVRDLSDNTIKTFMKSMEKFWIWSLYNPVGFDETFSNYQGRYREALRDGFMITISIKDEYDDKPVAVEILSSTPEQKATINKEIAGINSYFYFTEEQDLLYDHRFINYLYEKQRSAKSFLSSIEIKKSSLALEAFGKHKAYLRPYRVSRNMQRVRYLPLSLFDALLEFAKPREKLIYLLCGACSARIGQALNLTLYDIDYEKEEVWLINPKSDAIDIYGNKRRVWLKEEYDIDMLKSGPHNKPDLQFKYPIPLYQEPLFWIGEEKYKKLFFKTLRDYLKSDEYCSETIRLPRHPFLFVSKNGKRIHARETLTRFKTSLRKAVAKNKADIDISNLGLHALRHMYGHVMAEIYARVGDDSILSITQQTMGHSNLNSTLVYFNISGKTMRETIQRLTKNIHNK